jgi:hypothetical protein
MTKLPVIACVLLGSFVLTASVVATGSTNQTTITYMEEDRNLDGEAGAQPNNPRLLLRFAVTPNGMPACATSSTLMLDPRMGTDEWKAMTTLLTAAYLAGKTVRVDTNQTPIDGPQSTPCTIAGSPGDEALIENIIVTSGN